MKTLKIIVVFILFGLWMPQVAHGITITPSPAAPQVNQTVNFTVQSSYAVLGVTPSCTIEVNFGDGSPWVPLSACILPSCSRIVSHAYTSPGQYTVTARSRAGSCATPPQGQDPASIVLTVPCTSLSIASPASLPSGTVGQSYAYQLQAAGGERPYSFSLVSGTLPPGMSLNNAGSINGTPTAAGTYTFSVQVTDNCPVQTQQNQKTFTIRVDCAALSITSPQVLPEASIAQPYNYAIQASGGQPPFTFSIVSGSLPPGLSLSQGGTISGTAITQGTFNFTVRAVDTCSAGVQQTQKSFAITVRCPALAVTSPQALPAGTVGQAYSFAVQTSGGQTPLAFAIAAGALPPGMSLGSGGMISGTPTLAGTFNFTVRVTDSCTAGTQQAAKSFTLMVNCQELRITSPLSLPPGTAGQPYTFAIQTTGGQAPINFSLAAGSLPPGLGLSPSGVITGTPTSVGTFSFTVGAVDSCPVGAQTSQSQFGITVGCVPLVITSPNVLPPARAGQSYQYSIQTAGGSGALTFILASGSLPQGLSISPSGRISGTPAASGAFQFAVRISDSCPGASQSVQQGFALDVALGAVGVSVSPPSVSVSRDMAWRQNLNYTFSVDSPESMTLASDRGVYMAGASMLGEQTSSVVVNIANGSGVVSETVMIPVAVLKRAERLNTNRISYLRVFENERATVTARVDIHITTQAGAEFQINRLQLYFKNNKAEITVKRNYPDLQAFADIRFTGSGLLKGYWEVDGRIVEQVNRHLVYGTHLTLETPKVPGLPTFDPGTHLVRFVVTAPDDQIPLPEAIYFVRADESPKGFPIDLESPADGERVPYSPVTFQWDGRNGSVVFLVEFLGDHDEKPAFSAYTHNQSYQIPQKMLIQLFAAGKTYHWRVMGYDAKGNIIGESGLQRFEFTE